MMHTLVCEKFRLWLRQFHHMLAQWNVQFPNRTKHSEGLSYFVGFLWSFPIRFCFIELRLVFLEKRKDKKKKEKKEKETR
ncbi:hypothetical protein ACE6H2_003549 [Prunus campanulata]